MSSKRRIIIIAIVCVAAVLILAAVHLSTRTAVPDNAVAVEYEGDTVYIDLDRVETQEVRGEIVNGKGEKKPVDGSGVMLKELLEEKGVSVQSKVTVVADDEYSAEITASEIEEDERVYLLIEEREARLIVFGDENSKRNVSHVVRLIVE